MTEQNLHIGAQVHCRNGRCGKLFKLVVDPRERVVTHLILEQGFLLKHDRVLPRQWIERTTEKDIYLSIEGDQLENCEEYREVEIRESAPAAMSNRSNGLAPGFGQAAVPLAPKRLREGIPFGTVVLGDNAKVSNLMKTVGHLKQVMVDGETGMITALVVSRGLIPEAFLVQGEKVQELDDDYILVGLAQEELKGLPHYHPRSDEELQAEIEERLGVSSDLAGIRADVHDRVVRLTGRVASVIVAQHAVELVATVDGLAGVEDELMVAQDEAMHERPNATIVAPPAETNRITSALMDDPRTRNSVIEVIHDRGTVTLQGWVENAQTRQAAEEIVRAQPGVTVVHNELVFHR